MALWGYPDLRGRVALRAGKAFRVYRVSLDLKVATDHKVLRATQAGQ